MLQLMKDKLGDNEHPLNEPRLANVGHPPVDNDTGVENLEGLPFLAFREG